MSKLHLGYVTHATAKAAVMNWHYSRTMPCFKLVNIGVWEDDRFIGVVIFGAGACDVYGKKYGLGTFEVCELVRIAMRTHSAPISQMVKVALKMLKRDFPNLRLVVSFADPEHKHLGGIYQASNWFYTGNTNPSAEYIINGKRIHGRTVRMSLHPLGIRCTLESIRKFYNDPKAVEKMPEPKFRYLFPLDKKMRRQIEPLARPYPKELNASTKGTPLSTCKLESESDS